SRIGIGHRRLPGLATHGTMDPHRGRQTLCGAAGDRDRLPIELLPYLSRAVDTEVLDIDSLDLRLQRFVALGPLRSSIRIPFLRLALIVCRRGNRQHLADRLDPKTLPVSVDVRDHHFSRRSSSAWAKNADAVFRISLARLSSRLDRKST